MAIAAAAFLLASLVAWFTWTQIYVPKFFPESGYRVPWSATVLAAAAISALVAAALLVEPSGPSPVNDGVAPAAWVVASVAFSLALPWFALVYFTYRMIPGPPAAVAFILGLVWAGGSFARFQSWSTRPDWNDARRLAAVSGAVAASMLAGFPIMIASRAHLIDVAGKLLLNLVAVFLLSKLDARVQRRLREA